MFTFERPFFVDHFVCVFISFSLFFFSSFYCFCQRQILYRCTRIMHHSIDTLKSRETGDCDAFSPIFSSVFMFNFSLCLHCHSTVSCVFFQHQLLILIAFSENLFVVYFVSLSFVLQSFGSIMLLEKQQQHIQHQTHTKNSLQNFLYIHLRPYSSHSSEN